MKCFRQTERQKILNHAVRAVAVFELYHRNRKIFNLIKYSTSNDNYLRKCNDG